MNKQLLSARVIGFFLGPLLFLFALLFIPADFISPGANKVLAVAAMMITWWVTEAVAIPVTALLPLVLFPFMNVMNPKEAALPYADPIIFLFMGGFMIAMALEKHKLHERIALNLIRITGTSGNGIIMGFMIATAFISMWISNTATAMMMLPIALSVIELVKKDKTQLPHELPKAERNFALGLMLMVGYASTLGGLATVIGTPPNVVFKGLLERFYHEKIDFGKWMLLGVPVATTLLLMTYWMITRFLFPNRLDKIEGSDKLIADKLKEIGSIKKEEKYVLAVFAITSFFWIFQEAIDTYILGKEILNDTNIAMMGGMLMFLIPVDLANKKFLLEWKDTKQMQWGILLLFGGGLCLAGGLERTGVIQVVGNWIAAQSTFNVWLVFMLITAGVVLSEFMSNVALVQIFVPVIFGIADGLKVNPILLALPVTLSASIGFMFPVATPPNAIVFSSGYIRIKDMVKAGFLLDVLSILIILLASVTLLVWIFG
ncbi:SLC13 family permease [Ohtaekwangia koreensis]|uniref:Solute carrier family 13 (Sodium-dependent dicarboxylate transporter), member 2/3/5 n=1 Tax=Ohtaekwangia koreensis TaxID=688867 RepID=A0A1T5JJQ3_9BACT|nr:DASS family sodium-coupled anion symporter [Ohtaekwangia koreensis]SKC51639.1 solute carrier family 13 (sodium-dependent dicarboxylate transporter), member 2/3/5 [Ohtaekwangia koreensis]